MALATSLAPTPQAMKKPKRQARIMKISPCCAMIDIGLGSYVGVGGMRGVRDGVAPRTGAGRRGGAGLSER
ncbi:hypothetical protein HPA02_11840 [Bisbaumannia pacifica]|uniref:Uncharacterized protein n=1 Tax=Bisbaumannia pacifica TaxID=77098 RepID=A0A510X7C3_9GAMM|nr:hypothetical protein HPA02_11840 [Halomonas pacifica]